MRIDTIPIYAWILIAVLLLSQAGWIFLDASKHHENKWIWGLYGLTNCPTSLIIYLLVTRVVFKGKVCTNCGKKHKASFSFCPYCAMPAKNENKQN